MKTFKTLRAILSGAITWILIFVLWTAMIFIPVLKDSEILQYVIHYVVLIPIVILGSSYYYKSNDKTNGAILGLVMLATGLILDAIITVPFFTKPQGTGYAEFFINPLIWVGFVEFVIITYFYWAKKVKV
jgi:hypothetical protein